MEKWLLSSNNNANRCPICRHALYRHHGSQDEREATDDDEYENGNLEEDLDTYEESYDTYEGDYEEALEQIEHQISVENITDPKVAFEFTKTLVDGLPFQYQASPRAIQDYLDEMCELYNFKDCIPLGLVGESLRVLVYHMIKDRKPNSYDRIRRYWMSRLAQTLGWKLDEENMAEDYGSEYEVSLERRFDNEGIEYDSMDEW